MLQRFSLYLYLYRFMLSFSLRHKHLHHETASLRPTAASDDLLGTAPADKEVPTDPNFERIFLPPYTSKRLASIGPWQPSPQAPYGYII